jgi:hypothetical protein
MKKATAITCVFLDIGGVLLTNGWDHHARKRAAANFKLEWAEMEERHPTKKFLQRELPLFVPADLKLVDGDYLSIDQAALTGDGKQHRGG